MTRFAKWQEDCRAASLLCQKLDLVNSPLGTPQPDKTKEDLFRIPCKILLHNDGIISLGLKDFCKHLEEKKLHKSKPLKISHWEGSYDTENNRLGETTGKEQAGRTENNAAEQTPGGNGMDY